MKADKSFCKAVMATVRKNANRTKEDHGRNEIRNANEIRYLGFNFSPRQKLLIKFDFSLFNSTLQRRCKLFINRKFHQQQYFR